MWWWIPCVVPVAYELAVPRRKECHSSWLCPNSPSSVCNKALVAEPQSLMVRSQDTDMTISSPSERMSQRSKVCIEASVVESQRDPTSKIWRGWPWSFAGWPSALESISQLLVAVRIPKRMFFYDTIKSQQKSFAQLPAYRDYLVNKFPGAYCQLLHEEHGDHRFKWIFILSTITESSIISVLLSNCSVRWHLHY